uniref:Uncharacterized protein n=1 Tax=Cacopsylla melanoneura TaxID=428564 RepID=A0A8D8TNF8_9HEMI
MRTVTKRTLSMKEKPDLPQPAPPHNREVVDLVVLDLVALQPLVDHTALLQVDPLLQLPAVAMDPHQAQDSGHHLLHQPQLHPVEVLKVTSHPATLAEVEAVQ